jgi:hypothetical protein
MWPFANKKQNVTTEQFAMALLELMRKHAEGFCSGLQKSAEEKWNLAPDEVVILGDELLNVYLWMVSLILGKDKQVLNLLHDAHFARAYNSGSTKEEKARLANSAQEQLSERYTKYYKAWSDDMKANRSTALPMEIAQFLFPKRKPVLDIFLWVPIREQTAGFMISAAELRERFEIVET